MVQSNIFHLFLFVVISFQFIGNLEARVANYQFDKIEIDSQGCSISIHDDLVEPQPLFIIPGTEEFWNPQPDGFIHISKGDTIELYCSRSFNSPFKRQKFLKAECISRDEFLVKGERYRFKDFGLCTSNAYHIAQRTGETCHNDASIVEIGFKLDDGRFLRTIELCHDETLESTLYAHHILNPSSDTFQSGVSRVRFEEGDFYNNKDVNYLYIQKTQKRTLKDILNHDKFFDESKSLYLARGHLSAKADHIYGPQQRSTFFYVNVAPQWQVFNAGNWVRIEIGVRSFVAKRKLTVDCYTGTWDILTLPDRHHNYRELYLSIDDNNNYQIPVPKFYYRVIIDRKTQNGIVLIGVNNPYATIEEIKNDYILCDDVSDKINWIQWKKHSISAGYSYACDVNQFMQVVDHLPNLEVKGLLY